MLSHLKSAATFNRGAEAVETATFVNKFGKIELAPANYPRPNYDPVTGEHKGLLIEENRENLLERSEEFDNVYWETTGVGVSPDIVSAPSGELTADKIEVTNTTTSTKQVRTSINFTNGTTYTFSIFAKKEEEDSILLRIGSDAVTGSARAKFDLATEAISDITNCTASLINLSNGWIRCVITFTATATISDLIGVWLRGFESFSGNVGDGVIVWGAQLEEGSFPTSYIPTEGSAVTRAHEIPSLSEIDSFFNYDEGTFTGEFLYPAGGATNIHAHLRLDDGAFNQVYRLYADSNDGSMKFIIRQGGADAALISKTGYNAGDVIRYAVRYAAGEVKGYINGVEWGTVVPTALPTAGSLVRMQLLQGAGTQPLNDAGGEIIYYPKALDDSFLVKSTR